MPIIGACWAPAATRCRSPPWRSPSVATSALAWRIRCGSAPVSWPKATPNRCARFARSSRAWVSRSPAATKPRRFSSSRAVTRWRSEVDCRHSPARSRRGRAAGSILATGWQRQAAGLTDLAGGEAVLARTELAGHGDAAVGLTHVRQLVGPETLEEHVDALARAAADGRHRRRRRHPYTLLVEQPVQQALRRQRRIEHFMVFNRRGEMARAIPIFIVLALERGIARLIAHGAGLAAGTRQLLDQQSAGTPAPGRRRARTGGPVVASHRQADEGRQLFGLAEIGVRHLDQRLAFDGNNALIGILVTGRVDGHGDVTGAQQRALIATALGFGEQQILLVVVGITAHVARRNVVGDEKVEGAIGLGL